MLLLLIQKVILLLLQVELLKEKVKNKIVLRLLISKSNIDKVVKTYIYLTEDMFDLDSFKYIDKALGLGDRKISTDDIIKLRALRVVFNVIKAINTTS